MLCGNTYRGWRAALPLSHSGSDAPRTRRAAGQRTGCLQKVELTSNMFDKDLTTFYDKDWVNLTSAARVECLFRRKRHWCAAGEHRRSVDYRLRRNRRGRGLRGLAKTHQ